MFCSDLCAYAYDRCVTAIGFRAVRFTTKKGIKAASHSHASGSHSSGSGCSCGGVGQGYSECDEDDDRDYPRGKGVSNINLQMDGNMAKDLHMRYMEMERNKKSSPSLPYYIDPNSTLLMEGNRKNGPSLRYSNPIQIPRMDGTGSNEPTERDVIQWSTHQ